jgi:predicted DNA binding CopG/RHH family protein
MEKTVRRQKLPNTDSVEELAKFWDTHDVTDFEEELEEATEPIFVSSKGSSVNVVLPPADVRRLKGIARSMGVKETTVIRQWIVEKLRGAQRR